MSSAIRRLVDDDVEIVVAFSLAAWAPVFASFEAELGPETYRLVYPDWRRAQASAVEAVCRGVELAVVATGGDPGHAPARALYENLHFNAQRQFRYYRRL